MSEQSRAFLSDRDHSLLIDIFYKLIGNSEDPAEVQAIQDHRRLEEDQIKIYQDYDNLMREHLCLYRRFEKLHKKQLKGIQWVKKWIDRGRKHDDSRCN